MMTVVRRFIQFCFLSMALALAAVSCSRYVYRTAYQSADIFVLNRIDKYFDLNPEQEIFLKTALKGHLQRHKAQEMPKYEALLVEWRKKSADGLTGAEVDWLLGKIRVSRRDLMLQIKPDTIQFLSTLTDEQINYFEKSLADFDADLVKSAALTPEKRIEERITRMLETSEDWIGALSPEQLSKIRQHAGDFPDFAPVQLRFRIEREQQLVSFLRSHPDEKTLSTRLDTWLVDMDAGNPDYYKKLTQGWNEQMKKFLLELDPTVSPEQRAHALKKIDDLIEDVRIMRTQ